ncbi:hypothetical protein C5167_011009 [Papaver somniferum]|uniref:Uncharacterized protein n=1 Tax=Papaver somniferum TaxID=3469 RepID=A0A4Y7K535_PAPSO|nr:hypothetical protein C5167_011009 [Papaver somniferum]
MKCINERARSGLVQNVPTFGSNMKVMKSKVWITLRRHVKAHNYLSQKRMNTFAKTTSITPTGVTTNNRAVLTNSIHAMPINIIHRGDLRRTCKETDYHQARQEQVLPILRMPILKEKTRSAIEIKVSVTNFPAVCPVICIPLNGRKNRIKIAQTKDNNST